MNRVPFKSIVASKERRNRLSLSGAALLLLWPSAAQAHGLPDGFIYFVLASFVLITFVATAIVDYLVFRWWFVPDHPAAAAVLVNLVTVLTTIAGIFFYYLAGITEMIATRLEDRYGEHAEVARIYSWPIVFLILLFVNVLIKRLVLKLHFAVPYSPRLILALCLSNFSGAVLAVLAVFGGVF